MPQHPQNYGLVGREVRMFCAGLLGGRRAEFVPFSAVRVLTMRPGLGYNRVSVLRRRDPGAPYSFSCSHASKRRARV